MSFLHVKNCALQYKCNIIIIIIIIIKMEPIPISITFGCQVIYNTATALYKDKTFRLKLNLPNIHQYTVRPLFIAQAKPQVEAILSCVGMEPWTI